MMDKVRKGGRPLAKEIKALMGKVETEGYRRLLNIMHMNITQNTDIIETLKKQGSRMEEERTEDVSKYIEDLSGVPESLLSIGMIGPIILAVLGLFPQLVGDMGSFFSMPEQSTIDVVVNIGLFLPLRYDHDWSQDPHKGPWFVISCCSVSLNHSAINQ